MCFIFLGLCLSQLSAEAVEDVINSNNSYQEEFLVKARNRNFNPSR